jgi:hypothetical protein
MKMNMSKSNLVMAVVLMIISAACQKGKECTNESLSQYRYDARTGRCTNCVGQVGYNPVDTVQVRLTKNCECMDLSKHELAYLKEGITRENLFRYPVLEGYNFGGARMDSAQLFFALIENSDLSGANLATLQYGYASVQGNTDKFTQLPKEGKCVYQNDSLHCAR